MQRNKKLWLGAGAGLGLLWLLSQKSSSGYGVATDSDISNLAKMLIAETNFARDRQEMAQIVWVAINRAKGRGISLSQVVIPPGNPVWNTGSVYKKRFEDAKNNSALFAAAKNFVKEVLAGTWPELIDGRRMFIHPSGMPMPPCEPNRIASSTSAGTRCIPAWAANGKYVGGALFA